MISYRGNETLQDQEDEISDDQQYVTNSLPPGEENRIGKIQSVINASKLKSKQSFFSRKFDSYFGGCLPTSNFKLCEGGKRLVDRWELDLKQHLYREPSPMKAPVPYTESFELANRYGRRNIGVHFSDAKMHSIEPYGGGALGDSRPCSRCRETDRAGLLRTFKSLSALQKTNTFNRGMISPESTVKQHPYI